MITEFVKETLDEDIGRGDLFELVSSKKHVHARIIAKSSGVFAGKPYLLEIPKIMPFNIIWHINDGDSFDKGDVLVELDGDSHTLLKVERTFLNILLHASSIATHTRAFVKLIEPYGTKLLDTRKTRPKLRVFEKYATRIGGAVNHRMGLDDCLMIKDTHLATIDNLESFILHARKNIPFTAKVEIEAETFDVATLAMRAGADIVMCDNMSLTLLERVVEYKQLHYPEILLEASGNISLKTIEAYAKTGVDAISSGSMIHQAKWIDVSMKIDM